jgi:hypothetical protein
MKMNTLLIVGLLIFISGEDIKDMRALKQIDYFVYYFPEQDALVCSDKKQVNGMELANEFQSANGITCLVDFSEDGLYNLNLFIAGLDGGSSQPLIDVNIANQNLYKELDMNDRVIKNIVMAKEGFRLLFNADCEDISKCKLTEVKMALIDGKLLKLNFIIKKPKLFDTVLLEKDKTDKKEPFDINQKCDEKCEYGVCDNKECLCLPGYYGNDCSKGKLYLI